GRDVIVDGLRHADDGQAVVGEPLRGGERSLTADGDDRLDLVALHHLTNAIGPAVAFERVGAGSAEDGAALLADALHLVTAEGNDVFFDDTPPAAAEPDELLLIELVT